MRGKSGYPSKRRRLGVVRILVRCGIPVRTVNRGYDIGGLSGIWFAFGHRTHYSVGDLKVSSPVEMLARMAAARPRSIPVLVKHDHGTPYTDTVVSMRIEDIAPLLAGLIESDQARFIPIKEE